jgi:hypothetical protein
VLLRVYLVWLRVGYCLSLMGTSYRRARRGRCAWLLWRSGELQSRSLGRGNISLSVCTSPEPPFSATLGLAAALGLTFFGVRASWIAVVGVDPRTPFSVYVREIRIAPWGSSGLLPF